MPGTLASLCCVTRCPVECCGNQTATKTNYGAKKKLEKASTEINYSAKNALESSSFQLCRDSFWMQPSIVKVVVILCQPVIIDGGKVSHKYVA